MSRPSRAASELTIFILGFIAVWTLRATYGYAVDDSTASPGARIVYATAVKVALWLVPANGAGYRRGRMRPSMSGTT